jgi:preprotein translocase subunit Sec61beta
MAWEDLIRLLRRSRYTETVTNPPYAPPVQVRRGQKALDIARVSDSIFIKIRLAVLETLSVSDSANYLLSRLQQSVGDVISVSDLVDYLIHEYVRRNVTDNLSVSEVVNFVLSSISRITAAASDSLTLSELLKALRKDFAPRDSLSLSESVAYQLTTPQPSGYIIPDSYVVYNHYWQSISANLSVWWDNNTSTSYSIYYTPPAPSNPRYVYLYFNNPVSLPRNIEVYISGYTTGKTLYINTYFFGDLVSTASLVPNRVGWFTVTVNAGLVSFFDELEIKVDSNSIGFVAIAEFHVMQS